MKIVKLKKGFLTGLIGLSLVGSAIFVEKLYSKFIDYIISKQDAVVSFYIKD